MSTSCARELKSKVRDRPEEPPELPNLSARKSTEDIAWEVEARPGAFRNKLRRLLAKTEEADRKILLHMAQKMARPRSGRAASN
jgi:hypothetical protein